MKLIKKLSIKSFLLIMMLLNMIMPILMLIYLFVTKKHLNFYYVSSGINILVLLSTFHLINMVTKDNK